MKRKIKRHIFLPAVLLVYLAIMAIISYPRYKASGEWGEYFAVIGFTMALVVVLFFLLRRRQEFRDR